MKVIKEAQSNLLKIGKKYFYASGEDKKGNMVFKEVGAENKKKIDLLTKKIIPKLRDFVSVDDLLIGALGKMPMRDLIGVYERLYKKEGKKAKPKQIKGCLQIKVGKYRIPLQD